MAETGTAIDPLVVWAVALVALSGGITLLWRFLRGVRRILAKTDEFMDDWNGVPGRPGNPERPGVMARLANIEHELKRNSGESLRDAINRIEAELGTAPRR